MSSETHALPENRRAIRHRLTGAAVKVVLRSIDPAAEPSRGRVRDISESGGLYIETRGPLPIKTRVRVDMAIPGGEALSFSGAVVRSDPEGLAVMVEGDPLGAEFLSAFVPAAQKAHLGTALEIEVLALADESHRPVEVPLSRAWLRVRRSPDDPGLHQRFVDACLAHKRLDYALDRLRALKAELPDRPAIDASLAKVGHILGFVALHRAPSAARGDAARKPLLTPRAIVLLLVVLGLVGLITMTKVASHKVREHNRQQALGR